MKCELMIELKCAGFPFKSNVFCDHDSNKEVCNWDVSLSELIAACGNPFMLMWFEGTKEERVDWKTDHKGLWQAFNDTDSVCNHAKTGETAEEAVARLWLSLNKK